VNNIMPWVKANLAIVIISAVILVVLPASFVGSNMWNSKIRKGRENAVKTKWDALSNASVSLTLPPAAPGQTPTPHHYDAPNPAVIEYFKVHRKSIEEQVKQVTVEAELINKEGHTALVEGVFPTPANTTKTIDFAEALVGKGEKPSAYQVLLDRIKAGGPADPIKVREVLTESLQQAIDRNKAQNSTDKLSDEDQKKLGEKLSEIRIGQYMAHAKDISVYATRDALRGNILRGIPPEPPAVADCWKWQEDYWVISDVLTAVGEANKVNGKLTGVDQSVVKRILDVVIYPLESSGTPITGRKNSSANKSYDIRNATLKVIVSSSRLPQLIDAISRTDFMTVADVSFVEVERFRDLEQGFYYGDEHVIEATLTLETIWLRSWTTVLMPEAEKTRRESTPEAEAQALPPPSPRVAARMPDEDSSKKTPPKKGDRSTKRPGAKKGGE